MEFKEGQDIMVLGLLINGDRRDVGGRYVEKARGSKRGQHIVMVNGTRLNVPTEKIVDLKEYWQEKKLKKE